MSCKIVRVARTDPKNKGKWRIVRLTLREKNNTLKFATTTHRNLDEATAKRMCNEMNSRKREYKWERSTS